MVLSLLIITACSSLKNNQINTKIIALSHYPNCAYKVIDTIKVRSGKELNNLYNQSNSPLSMRVASAQGNKESAIQELKIKAAKLGADAIAVIAYKNDKKLISTNMSAQAVTLNHYYYTAQAINMCNEASTESINIVKRKPVKYLIDGSYNL